MIECRSSLAYVRESPGPVLLETSAKTFQAVENSLAPGKGRGTAAQA
jgi:hypothetical protein